jgi:hypothetical protein
MDEPKIPIGLPLVGDVWHWQPLDYEASEEVTVRETSWNGREWMVRSQNAKGKLCWNDLALWIESTVFVRKGEENNAS